MEMEQSSREDLQGLTILDADDFFLDQMLSTLTSPPPSWPISSSSTKLRLHHDNFLSPGSDSVAEAVLSSGLPSSFKPLPPHLNGIAGGSVDSLYNNGFGSGDSGLHQGIISANDPVWENSMQEGGLVQTTPSFGIQPDAAMGGSNGGGTTAAPPQPRQRVRARRGQATDPHSIAERLRRERIAERMKSLQELVPNANKTDKASMLDEIIDYVKFLQLQVKVLSMSRLGGAAAVAPLVAADMSSSEGGGGGGGGGGGSAAIDCGQPKGVGDSLTVTEHQVAKLMEEDMGSAMQFLQGKGLCLMPISLATAISTATCQQPRATKSPPLHFGINGDIPSSPGISALTVQSATPKGSS